MRDNRLSSPALWLGRSDRTRASLLFRF